jgi:hypothetical protein
MTGLIAGLSVCVGVGREAVYLLGGGTVYRCKLGGGGRAAWLLCSPRMAWALGVFPGYLSLGVFPGYLSLGVLVSWCLPWIPVALNCPLGYACPHAGHDALDSTSSGLGLTVPDFAAGLLPAASLSSRPLAGKRLGLVTQTLGEGVAPEVNEAIKQAARHLESLGATVEEVRM